MSSPASPSPPSPKHYPVLHSASSEVIAAFRAIFDQHYALLSRVQAQETTIASLQSQLAALTPKP